MSNSKQPSKFMLQIASFVAVAFVFVILCFRLINGYDSEADAVNSSYRDAVSCNLDANVNLDQIKSVIANRGYYTDTNDISLVAQTLYDSLHAGQTLSELRHLRKRIWKLPVSAIPYLSRETKLTVAARNAQNNVGAVLNTTICDDAVVDLKSGTGSISVSVDCNDTLLSGVVVCLRLHSFDSTGYPTDSVIATATTSDSGTVCFKGLDMDSSYSVLPVRDGYEYGSSQGTTGGTLGKTARRPSGWKERIKSVFGKTYGNLSFSFHQQPLRIPLFSDATISQMREDHAFTVRTPEQWIISVTRMSTLFLISWALLCFVMWMRRRAQAAIWPVSVLMAITGIGLLGMLSFNDPFTDGFIAHDYFVGVVFGVAAMALLQFIDIRKRFSSRWFDAIGQALGNKGLGYYFLALALTLLLFTPLGRSVGGMGVNLKIGPLTFQPSEIAKYLIVVFMSAWFCRKADTLIGYSDEGNLSLFWNKVRHVAGIFIALVIMLAIYMVLGDMGPGMVLLFSFIIIYSVVKSKSLRNSCGDSFMKGVVKSDIFILLSGVVSFVLILWIGGLLHLAGFFAAMWFIVWILAWALARRQFMETPIMANAVIAVFVFAKNLPGSIGERFATRSAMCANPWGSLGIDGTTPSPVPNSQVADGLWGLASGGLLGQGFGNGSPNFIPAFHTDMVLSSIGEVMGWVGIVTVIVLLLVLLSHTLAVGYRSRHHFSFFLCLGIAVVTAVQFAIIALGSTGIIPLTGIAVPLLSYGKVGMIMTLTAFGLVLSVETFTAHRKEPNAATKAADNLFKPYDPPLAVTRLAWFVVTIFIIGVYSSSMLWGRNKTLVRPLFVTAQRGDNQIQYNPRIAELTRKLHAGNIYDRKGLLLATSVADSIHAADYSVFGIGADEVNKVVLQRSRRYYPLGDRLLFMVGNLNSAVSLAYNENYPVGYVAESQHMSYLRGYDNVLYTDEEHKHPYYVDINSDAYRADRYQNPIRTTAENVIIRDYSSLLPLLKAGRNERKIERVNERTSRHIKPQDLHLTIDAKLQCVLQDRIASYVEENFPNKRLMRVSAVVLDAQNGDLLASALYPLPNKDTLLAHSDEKYYNDAHFAPKRRAYTDRDLGLAFFTAPGSTAKVMTAMAGLQKYQSKAAQQTYFIPAAEQVEVGIEPTGNVTMENAIVMSSNCYFIHLMNDLNLYSSLDSIYASTGVQIGKEGDGRKIVSITPYKLSYNTLTDYRKVIWNEIVSNQQGKGLSYYNQYKVKRDKEPRKMNYRYWQWAWGQGTLAATPLSMARVMSAVVNGGVMPRTRYRLDDPVEEGIRLISSESANLLKSYLRTMADKANGHPENAIHDKSVGGKTGTPERQHTKYNKMNDGWFVFYVDDCNVSTADKKSESHPIAVAVRMERGVGSGPAMRLSRDVVLEVLRECGYYNRN